MAEYDLKNLAKVVPAFNPISNSAGGNGLNIDTRGYESVLFTLQIGAIASGTITATLEHADDNGSGAPGSYSAAGADDVIGTSPISLATANTSGSLGYRGKKRWVRIVTAGTYTTCVNGAHAVLSSARRVPAV